MKLRWILWAVVGVGAVLALRWIKAISNLNPNETSLSAIRKDSRTPEERNAIWISLQGEFFNAGRDEDKGKVVEKIREFAQSGDQRAQQFLGMIYERGLGVAADPHEALRWYSLAKRAGIDNGPNEANLLGGLHFLDTVWPSGETKTMTGAVGSKNIVIKLTRDGKTVSGKGYAQPFEREFTIQGSINDRAQADWTVPGDPGNLSGAYHGQFLAQNVIQGNWTSPGTANAESFFLHAIAEPDYETQKAAMTGEHGDASPADAFTNGQYAFEQRNYTEALRWFESSARRGYAYAQDRMGWMLLNGFGVPQDYRASLVWYQKAADQGDPTGEDQVGWLYLFGLGTARDPEKAKMWYQKAADQGDELGQTQLGQIYEYDSPPDYVSAIHWYERAVAQGSSLAMNNMGYLNEHGMGVSVDYLKAFRWYASAAEKNNPRGEFHLGQLYEAGLGVAPDKAQARQWMEKAAAHGDADARSWLSSHPQP